jgi:hypothetical protein
MENMVRKYTGIEDKTELRSFSLADLLRKLPFHRDKCFPTLSIKGWICSLLGCLIFNGSPK